MLVITFAKHNSTERNKYQYLIIFLSLRTKLIFCNDFQPRESDS